MTKPCGKIAIHKAIDRAKEALDAVSDVSKAVEAPAVHGLGITA